MSRNVIVVLIFTLIICGCSHLKFRRVSNNNNYLISKDGVEYDKRHTSSYFLNRFTSSEIEYIRDGYDSLSIFIDRIATDSIYGYGTYGVSYRGFGSKMDLKIFFKDSSWVYFAEELNDTTWLKFKDVNRYWISNDFELELDNYYEMKWKRPVGW